MAKIRKGNEIIKIDCDNEMCGECSFKPSMSESQCKLFDVVFDHVVGDFTKNSGWKRHPECINAEVKG